MQISWNGLGSFTIVAKPAQGDVTVVTDPYDNATGLRFPRTLAASLVVESHKGKEASNVEAIAGEESKKPFVVDYPGEYEVKGVFVYGMSVPKKDGSDHTIYRLTAEGIRIGFLGALDRVLTDKEIERLGTIDVLIVPVGGGKVLSKTSANEIVAQIEPRMVIPSYYETPGLKEKFDDVDGFCKELSCPREDVGKLKLTKSALPEDDIKIVVLTR